MPEQLTDDELRDWANSIWGAVEYRGGGLGEVRKLVERVQAMADPLMVIVGGEVEDVPGAIRLGAEAYAFEARDRLLAVADRIERAHAG